MPDPTDGPDDRARNISDKLKQTIDELQIDRHVNDFAIQVESAFTTARDRIAILAAERGDEVERVLDKVSATLDERTEGRYAAQLDKLRERVSTGVSRLAEQRPSEPGPVWPVDEIDPPPAD